MKRVTFFIVAIAVIAASAFTLTACKKRAHVHAWGEGVVTKEVTCGADGEMLFTCACGATKTEAITARPAHTMTDGEETFPTCDEDGFTAGTYCTVCGFAESGHVRKPALGHDYDDGAEIQAPTCKNDGIFRRTCKRDGCGHHNDEPIAKLAHTVETIKGREATCIEPGQSDGERCVVCGDILVEPAVIPALGHNMTEWIKPTPDGALTHELVAQHTMHCTRCELEVSEPCAFDQKEIAATCDESGKHVHTCATCGFSFTHNDVAAPALGHRYDTYEIYDDESGTFKHKKICSRNPAHFEIESCEEHWSEGKRTEATCQSKAFDTYVCTLCHAIRNVVDDTSAILPHAYKYTYIGMQGKNPTHSRLCTKCGERTSQTCTMKDCVEAATCTENGSSYTQCEFCERIAGSRKTLPATGHNFTAWEHYTDENGDFHRRHCQNAHCDVAENNACTLVDASHAATCDARGFDGSICSVCRFVKGEETPQLLHEWEKNGGADKYYYSVQNGEWYHYRKCGRCGNSEDAEACADHYNVQTTPPSCGSDGEIVSTCSVCNSQKTEVIKTEYPGHSFVYSAASEPDKKHHVKCSICKEEMDEDHSYGETNICGCGRYGLVYTEKGGFITVTGPATAAKNVKHIIVPETIDGKFVTALSVSAFSRMYNLETVRLPYTLLSISAGAFSGCTKLREVIIGDGNEGADVAGREPRLAVIGGNAFADCKALTAIVLPDSLTEIGDQAFENCTSLKELDIPASVTTVGEAAFFNSALANNPDNLTDGGLYVGRILASVSNDIVAARSGEFSVLDGTTIIAAGAFRGCTALTKLVLPASVTEICRNAFGYPANFPAEYVGTPNLERVEFMGTAAQWFAIKFEGDYANPMHYAARLHIDKAEASVTIPDGATSIPNGTFRNDTNIQSVHIPDSVKVIGDHAFAGCVNLKEINIPDSVIEIGTDAFADTALIRGESTSHPYKDGLLYIGHHLIKARADVVSGAIVLNENTITICGGAFENCTQVTEVTLSGKLMFIGARAFAGLNGTLSAVRFRPHENGGVWMAWSDLIGRGKTDADVSNDSRAAANATDLTQTYLGEWKFTPAAA